VWELEAMVLTPGLLGASSRDCGNDVVVFTLTVGELRLKIDKIVNDSSKARLLVQLDDNGVIFFGETG
jgi:hypothetical protein